VLPSGKRAVAIATAGAFSAAGVAYAVAHRYSRRLKSTDTPTDPELEVPEDVVHRVLTMRDGGESHLIERGEGPPLLLLHGANLSAEVWSYQLRDLALSHRVIAPDLRGHGASTPGLEGVTISAMAGDVAELMTVLDLEGAVLTGHSMGGMVCLRVARRHPELFGTRIGALGLIATSGGLGLPLPSWSGLAGAVSRVAGAGVGIWRPGRPKMATADVGYFASRLGFGRRPRQEEVAATLRMLRAMEPGVFNEIVGEVLSFEERAVFSDVGVPVVVAVGTSDHLTPPLFARRLASSFEHASLFEFAGAGHMLMYERREEIDKLLASVAARVVPRTLLK
jgi:pimeloyl-ACP methyl ester carboxylesterase